MCVHAYESKVKVLVAQSYRTLWDPMDCGPPGSSARGILQGRILEWVALLFSRGSSHPRNQTLVSCITGRFFTIWAMGSPTYIFINTHINMYIYIPLYISIYIYPSVCVYICVCVYTHTFNGNDYDHRHKSFDCTSVNCAWQVLYISFLKFC